MNSTVSFKTKQKLEDHPLWQAASGLAVGAYKDIEILHEDEKWGMISQLRMFSLSLTAKLAEALGSIDPRDQKHFFGNARKDIYGLKNVYLIGTKTGHLETSSDLLAKFDWLTAAIEAEIEKATQSIPGYMKQFEGKHDE